MARVGINGLTAECSVTERGNHASDVVEFHNAFRQPQHNELAAAFGIGVFRRQSLEHGQFDLSAGLARWPENRPRFP
jgi:hypothetical protein